MEKFALIYMVGPFPPPVHGVSTVNEFVLRELQCRGAAVRSIPTGAATLSRNIIDRLKRMRRIIAGLFRLSVSQCETNAALYISAAGGYGQVYDCAFILLARIRCMRVFVHHHSYAYIARRSAITRLLFYVAGSRATHITQSHVMSARLRGLYGATCGVSASNVYLLDALVEESRVEVGAIGFLGNISDEKGIHTFLDVCAAMEQRHPHLRAFIAGPFQDGETERAVRLRISKLGNSTYVGPVYGADKIAFFKSIDVFLFPTAYENETEGIVNHEALRAGVPVIAYGRGCIPEIVSSDCGLVIDPATDFVAAALGKIDEWIDNPGVFKMCSNGALAQFRQCHSLAAEAWQALFKRMLPKEESAK